jgi:hypothetical protein
VIIVEWGNDQWDFILVPRSTLLHQGPRRGATGSCQQNDHDLSGLLPEEWGIGIHLSATAAANTLIVKWIDDDGEQQEKTLDRTDIPIRNAVQPLTFRFLEVTVSLNGDFKFTFCCAGRPNHDTSKCLKCDRIKSDWKEGYCKGCLYTLQNMQKDRDDYIAANAPPPQNETIAATVTRAELKTLGNARVKQTGIKDLEEIFTNIPKENIGDPQLHCKLGVVNNIFNRIFECVNKEIEKPLPSVLTCTARLNEALDTGRTQTESLVQYKTTHSRQYNEKVAGCKKLDKLLVNTRYLELEERFSDAEARALTASMKLELEAFQTQIDGLSVHFFRGSPARRQAEIDIENYEMEVAALQLMIESAEADREKIAAELSKLKASISYKPVKRAVEAVCERYNVVLQQSYTMTLVGKSCQRLCQHRAEICPEIVAIMTAEIDQQESDSYLTPQDATRKREVITTFMAQIDELLECFHLICIYTSTMNRLPMDERLRSKRACEYFGTIYRSYFNSAPPKLHYIETHIPDSMMRFGRLGPQGEDPIERSHHIMLGFNRTYAAIRRTEIRQKYVKRMMDQASISGVVDATALVADSRVRKGTAGKRAAAENIAAAEKKTKCDDTYTKIANNMQGNVNT